MTLISTATLKKNTVLFETHFFLSLYDFHVIAASLLSDLIQLYYCFFVLVPLEKKN